jgi:hypothetical protein
MKLQEAYADYDEGKIGWEELQASTSRPRAIDTSSAAVDSTPARRSSTPAWKRSAPGRSPC